MDQRLDLKENAFDALLAFWTFVCVSSVGVLVTFDYAAWTVVTGPRYGRTWSILFLKTVIAGSTELRFFYGHLKYLTRVSKELQLKGTPPWRRAAWDFFLICLLTICKLIMAIEISDSEVFINAFVGLMLCDLFWLAFEPRVRSVTNMYVFKPCRWMWINLTTAVVILAYSRFDSLPSRACTMGTIGLLAVAVGNCLLDFCNSTGPVHQRGR